MVSKISSIAFALIGLAEAVVYDFVANSESKADLERSGVVIGVGETATFILSQNLSTGYGWEINESVANGVYSVTSENKEAANTDGMFGVPGTKKITVNGLKKGFATLQAAYVRPWEKATNAADTFNVKITVGDAPIATRTT